MLPDSWVESIFARLSVRYGSAWLRLWEGIDIAAVKADWADCLSGLSGDSIKHALQHLPADKPPTVAQFKALCVSRPEAAVPQLPAPIAKQEAVDRARELGISIGRVGSKEWAHELRRRELACDRLTAFQWEAWREALAADQEAA